MTCDYLKNKLKRDIRLVKKAIARNESYIAYYDKHIADGTATKDAPQSRADNQVFLDKMREELLRLEGELQKL